MQSFRCNYVLCLGLQDPAFTVQVRVWQGLMFSVCVSGFRSAEIEEYRH